jgi:hypothetical protein
MDGPSFDTQFSLVHGTGFARKGPNDFSIEDLQEQAATTPAVRTEA